MGWEALIPIIVQYGIPLAEKLFQKWATGTPPTQADFDELKAMANEDSKAQALKVITNLNLTVDDPQAKMILGLVS